MLTSVTKCVYIQDSGPQLVSLLRDGLKSWLLNDNETWTRDFDLADMLEKAHADYMVPVLYKYDVWPDFRNTENSIISVCLQIFLRSVHTEPVRYLYTARYQEETDTYKMV